MGSSLFRHKFGNGGLITCRSQGEGQGEYRAEQLVDSHFRFPEQAREVDAVKKTDEPADETCGGKDKCAHNQRVSLFFHVD